MDAVREWRDRGLTMKVPHGWLPHSCSNQPQVTAPSYGFAVH